MKNQEKIENIEAAIKKLQEQVEELKEEKIDFSKFVGKDGRTLAIKGDRYLLSYSNGDIGQSTVYSFYKETPDYIHTTVSELEKGDVFITEEEVELGMDISSFNIYVANGWAQYLLDIGEVEIIENSYSHLDTEVIKFLRN